MKRVFILTVFYLLSQSGAYSQIVINEVGSTGSPGFVDEDGEQQDWLELYNPGASPVNLVGYSLTYQENNQIIEWKFPQIFINPNDH
ncbi:MAG: lamin tail domain-containing protein, partial [Flavobacteriales bacterium]